MEDDFDENAMFPNMADPLGVGNRNMREIHRMDQQAMTPEQAMMAVPDSPSPIRNTHKTGPTTPANPLAKYFRPPAMSVQLPTGGAFMPEGSVDFDETGAVEVHPMRAADELLLKSPDALMNNRAIINLIKSCVPSIKEPKWVSSHDLDALLIAIQIASTGPEKEVTLSCPECEKPNTYGINLPSILQAAIPVPPEYPVRLNDAVVAYIRPHTLEMTTQILIQAFRESRIAQAISMNETLTDAERDEETSQVMHRLRCLQLGGVAAAISHIAIPEGEVSEDRHILEFVENMDTKSHQALMTAIETFNKKFGVSGDFDATCVHCAHEWVGGIEFNPASFFEARS